MHPIKLFTLPLIILCPGCGRTNPRFTSPGGGGYGDRQEAVAGNRPPCCLPLKAVHSARRHQNSRWYSLSITFHFYLTSFAAPVFSVIPSLSFFPSSLPLLCSSLSTGKCLRWLWIVMAVGGECDPPSLSPSHPPCLCLPPKQRALAEFLLVALAGCERRSQSLLISRLLQLSRTQMNTRGDIRTGY